MNLEPDGRSVWQNGPMPYFDDQLFHGVPGDLNPWDIRFDPTDAAHLSIESDGRIRFRLVTEPSFQSATVVTDDGVGHDMERLFDERSIQTWETALDVADGTRYTFALETNGGRPVYRVPAGVGNAVERLDRWIIDLSTTRRSVTPAWTHGMVMYQVFPERFHDGDASLSPEGVVPWGTEPAWLDFQGGDLVGIESKADHIESLGVDCVYLNPIFESLSTHRYDAINYRAVDPTLGGNDALRSLVAELHGRGIRIILDASFNHCHPRFFAFADVIENGPSSDYSAWFNVTDWPPRVIVRPERIAAEGYRDPDQYMDYLERFAATSGVIVERATDDGPGVEVTYEAWYGVPTLPRIDLSNPAARDYFLDVARHWIRDYEIDGWRMDVARYVDFDFWPEFREVVKAANSDSYLIAEIMGNASPWLQGDTFDATMNYTFRQLLLDFAAKQTSTGFDLADGLALMYSAYSPETVASSQNLLSSHDTARFLHEAGEHAGALRLATVLQMTLPGSPGLYYGDEISMTGGEEPGSRGAFPWHDPDVWDHAQLETVRSLTALRRSHPALRNGALEIVSRSDDGISFMRSDGSDRVLIAIHRGEHPEIVTVPVESEYPEVVWGSNHVSSTGEAVAIESLAGAAIVSLGPLNRADSSAV
ncbi:MAG: glycoside hydrolase family 13 protein [Actinomycetota bacterium]|nr:glycoside hydrolase family 13 protein [Actinomycetota bacterium]